MTDTDVRFKLLERDFGQLTQRRNGAAVLLLLALAAPVLCFMLVRLGRWVWGAKSSSLATSEEAATLSRYKAAYLWGSCVAGALLLAFFLSPEKAAQAAISGAIQSVGIAAVAWLFFRLWRGRTK